MPVILFSDEQAVAADEGRHGAMECAAEMELAFDTVAAPVAGRQTSLGPAPGSAIAADRLSRRGPPAPNSPPAVQPFARPLHCAHKPLSIHAFRLKRHQLPNSRRVENQPFFAGECCEGRYFLLASNFLRSSSVAGRCSCKILRRDSENACMVAEACMGFLDGVGS